jgi:hypothetical protein
MKFAAAVLALAGFAVAAPSTQAEKRDACTFGTYRCTTPNTGIEICDIYSTWQKVGDCAPGEHCANLPQNGFTLPFCTSNAVAKRNGRPGVDPGYCATPGQYTCLGATAIQVCDTQHALQKVGDCPAGSHCGYLNGIPYCVN